MRQDRGSEDQFLDKLGQTSPAFCPQSAFGGQFSVAFDQLGEELTRRLTVLQIAGGHHLEDGAHIGWREWREWRE